MVVGGDVLGNIRPCFCQRHRRASHYRSGRIGHRPQDGRRRDLRLRAPKAEHDEQQRKRYRYRGALACVPGVRHYPFSQDARPSRRRVHCQLRARLPRNPVIPVSCDLELGLRAITFPLRHLPL